MYYSGGCVGFYSGDIKELTNDLKALRPTVIEAFRFESFLFSIFIHSDLPGNASGSKTLESSV